MFRQWRRPVSARLTRPVAGYVVVSWAQRISSSRHLAGPDAPTVSAMRTIGAALAALALLAVGCTEPSAPEAESFTPTFESAPCPVPVLPGFPQLNLGPEFSCGYLVVPENRSRPNGRTIKIAVARAKARSADPRPDPLLYLTGGPGGPALPLANGLVAGDLNRDRDLILIDQRGTLHAQPALTCPEIDAFTAAATGMSIQAPSTAEKDLAAVRACRDRLAADGTDLAAFDTSENASDVADLRTALGIRDVERLRRVLRQRPCATAASRSPRRNPQPRRRLRSAAAGQPDRAVLAERGRRADGAVRRVHRPAVVRTRVPRTRRRVHRLGEPAGQDARRRRRARRRWRAAAPRGHRRLHAGQPGGVEHPEHTADSPPSQGHSRHRRRRRRPGGEPSAGLRHSPRCGRLRPDVRGLLPGERGVHRYACDSRRSASRPSTASDGRALAAAAGAAAGRRMRASGTSGAPTPPCTRRCEATCPLCCSRARSTPSPRPVRPIWRPRVSRTDGSSASRAVATTSSAGPPARNGSWSTSSTTQLVTTRRAPRP